VGLQHSAAEGPGPADFPGIQVAEEPPEDVLQKKNWPRGTEMLGCYHGVVRTKQSHLQMRVDPDLIFVFRGPILRCSEATCAPK